MTKATKPDKHPVETYRDKDFEFSGMITFHFRCNDFDFSAFGLMVEHKHTNVMVVNNVCTESHCKTDEIEERERDTHIHRHNRNEKYYVPDLLDCRVSKESFDLFFSRVSFV